MVNVNSASIRAKLKDSKQGSINSLNLENLSEEDLLKIENEVCSYGDTVHYAEKPKFFKTCKDSYLLPVDFLTSFKASSTAWAPPTLK